MGVSIPQQLELFLQSVLLGGSLGLAYDVLRAVRRLGGSVLQAILDGVYALGAAAALFVFVMAGDGELRLFVLAGAAGGMVLHFCLFSAASAPILALWLRVFLIPGKIIYKIVKKAEKICKNLFSFCKYWFTILCVAPIRCSIRPDKGKGVTDMARRPSQQSKTVRRKSGGKLTFLLLLILLVGVGVQLQHMLHQLDAARAEESVYAARVDELEETNARLSLEIANSSDQELLESIARDDLGMAAPGEKIFRFN